MDKNEIQLYFHCKKCITENVPTNIGAGWTPHGIQVWCQNHDMNIIHVDFEGIKHKTIINERSAPYGTLVSVQSITPELKK